MTDKTNELYIVKTEHHSIYEVDHPTTYTLTNGDDAGANSLYTRTSGRKEYRVYIGDISDKEVDLQPMLHVMSTKCLNSLVTVYISSNGGYLSQGIQLYTKLLGVTARSNIATVITSHAYSMSGLLFCMGERRIINPHSLLMFHNFSTLMAGKGGELKDDLNSTSKMFKNLMRELVIDPGFITKKEMKRILDGKDLWLGAEEMARRGIATHVTLLGDQITAKEYLATLADTSDPETTVPEETIPDVKDHPKRLIMEDVKGFPKGGSRYIIGMAIVSILNSSDKNLKLDEIKGNITANSFSTHVEPRGLQIIISMLKNNGIISELDTGEYYTDYYTATANEYSRWLSKLEGFRKGSENFQCGDIILSILSRNYLSLSLTFGELYNSNRVKELSVSREYLGVILRKMKEGGLIKEKFKENVQYSINTKYEEKV